MDKWLKKSVEVNEDKLPVSQKTDKSSQSETSQSKRRKVLRRYDDTYLKMGFTWNEEEQDPRPRCVVCYEQLANESMCPNKLLRHLETKHPELKHKPLDFFKKMLANLNTGQRVLQRYTSVNEKALYASYLISLRIAKTGKPHTLGETLVLPAIKDTVEVFFGDKSKKEIEAIPISNDTVTRRIDEMSQWVENQVIERVIESPFFSLQLDESTDVEGLCQLLVFVRYIWNSEPHEDMLLCEPISRSTSQEIFNAVDIYFRTKGLDWLKCIGICTDGARTMCGRNSSVVTKILERNPNASWTHCNLHRAALVSKHLSDNFKNVLNTSVKIVNFIKSKPLQTRLFEKLCEEMGSNHRTLLLHTEIRWLSRGKVLTRLGELREEVAMFLEGKCDFAKCLRDKEFILRLTYLADIFSKLNELNLYLQGTGGIFEVHDKIRGFIKKLALWKNCIDIRNYECFEMLQTFIIENEVELCDGIISEIPEHLNKLKKSFEFYFHDEMNTLKQKRWVINPFQPAMTTGISTKADEELIDLSEDSSLKMNFSRTKLVQFWVSLLTLYPLISTEALKALIPFSSSYKCETGFSAMVGIKTKFRNKLRLSNSLRLKLSQIEINVKSIVQSSKKQAHPSH